MDPYYQRAGVTLYHGDAAEILPTFATDTVDLLVTDPPYGVNWQSGTRKEAMARIVGDDDASFVPAILGEALRVLRRGRHLYLFGPFDLADLPVGGSAELVWDKGRPNAGNLAVPWGPSHERIMFGVKVPSRANREDGMGKGAARLRRASVLRYPRLNSRAVKRHPTEKPVPLLRELIESSSRQGEIVLDPFVGSGSTLVAALVEGRGAIGIEIDERFCEVAAERIEAVAPLLSRLNHVA